MPGSITIASRLPVSGRHALEQLPDNELVLEALGGDAEAAFTELIRRYAPRLRRLLYTLVGGDTDLMEDAEQEVFVALVRRLGSFRGDSAFSTFFYALARNRVTDLLRSRRRRRHRYRELAEPDRFAARTAGPERQAIDLERVEMLRTALDILTANDRVMLGFSPPATSVTGAGGHIRASTGDGEKPPLPGTGQGHTQDEGDWV